MLDLIVRRGSVVDGSGAPARRADVAVAGGRIVEVGAVPGPARRTVDADGLVVVAGSLYVVGAARADALASAVPWEEAGR